MNALLPTITRLFLSVAGISCEASILVLIILAAQLLLGRRLAGRWRNALWLLVLLRLLLPALPASPFSVYRATPPAVVISAMQDETTPAPGSTSLAPLPTANSWKTGSSSLLVRAIQLGAVAWLIGGAALALATTGSNWQFDRRLRRASQPADDKITQLARESASELGIRRSFSVLETGLVDSPALFGLLHPRLLLPAGLASGLSYQELRLILLHELAHLRRGDLYHHGLLSVLQVVHWFNPLLWFAFGRMRDDREIAADALVLSGERARLKTSYGHMLLKLIEESPVSTPAVQLVGILENPRQLRQRLERIRRATPNGNGWSRPGLAVICLLGVLFLTRAYGDARTMVIEAKATDQPWGGWGYSSPVQDSPAVAPEPEEFSLETNSPSPRVFSGKVESSGSMEGFEIGLVSLVGVHWVNPGAYQWQPVERDGTFSLTDSHYLEAPKAIVVRGPGIPWTFLRYNFGPDESATDIVLRPAPARTIRLTVGGPDGKDLPHASFELFPAHAEYDDQGRALRRQRLGEFSGGEATFVQIAAPAGEVAVFAHHAGYAGYYHVIDTRQADRFHFVLQQAGSMKISVVDGNGQPKAGIPVRWINPAAPLSISGSATNAQGSLSQGDLTPGTFVLNVAGFAPRQIKVLENSETEAIFREGIDP